MRTCFETSLVRVLRHWGAFAIAVAVGCGSESDGSGSGMGESPSSLVGGAANAFPQGIPDAPNPNWTDAERDVWIEVQIERSVDCAIRLGLQAESVETSAEVYFKGRAIASGIEDPEERADGVSRWVKAAKLSFGVTDPSGQLAECILRSEASLGE